MDHTLLDRETSLHAAINASLDDAEKWAELSSIWVAREVNRSIWGGSLLFQASIDDEAKSPSYESRQLALRNLYATKDEGLLEVNAAPFKAVLHRRVEEVAKSCVWDPNGDLPVAASDDAVKKVVTLIGKMIDHFGTHGQFSHTSVVTDI